MAQILMDQKQPDNAAAALGVALGIRTRLAGPLDASLLPVLDQLGAIQNGQHDYEKAESTYRHSLAIRETLLGKEDADLLAPLDGLAAACFGQAKYDVAEPIYQRLLALWIKSAGGDHPMIAITLDKIADFYAAQKKYGQAKDSFDRATVIRTLFLANGLAAEAAEELSAENNEAAKALYQRVIKVLDPPDPMYEDLRAATARMLEQMDKLMPPPQPKKPAPPAKKTAAPL
jgi:tetratricopeptide (TPR) repeat protein